MIHLIYLSFIVLLTITYIFITRKELSVVEDYESKCKELFNAIDELNTRCCDILQNEIYSDEPIVRALVDSIKHATEVFSTVSKEYVISVEPPEPPKWLNSYRENK